MQAFFFKVESATHWHESVRKIELWQNFLELGQIFLEFCQNLAIFTKKSDDTKQRGSPGFFSADQI